MKKIIIGSLVLASVCLTSCLKDKDYEDLKYGTQGTDVTKLITFVNAKNLPTAEKAKDSISVGGDVNVSAMPQISNLVNVTLESTAPSNVAVRVKVKVNPSLKPSTYVTLPAGTYSIPSEIVFPAGVRQITLPITFANTTTYSLTSTYALGLELESADGGYSIAPNRNRIVAAFSVKNAYDGKYSYKGYAFRSNSGVLDASLTGNFSGLTRTLATISATAVQMNTLFAWGNGSGIGITEPVFDVNPATNVVTMSTASGFVVLPLPGYNSRYEPSTKTFYVAITWGAGPGSRQSIDTLTYTGPR